MSSPLPPEPWSAVVICFWLYVGFMVAWVVYCLHDMWKSRPQETPEPPMETPEPPMETPVLREEDREWIAETLRTL